ncbi:hypothetical protein SAMN02800694_2550 [Luteibacter sp. UNCMF331Sha3.1]|uniref:hypothetical protein n=1 Tax=Luteibacter sp. UNCMF331Sha3.1 TaxID=1502760 RepID=UPI0008C6EBC4|nr:hypothetical protein [Luteibacter sp. UNCMF331Sha3.1]SEN03165.1 hypothetical protein SAMN02800694_2550 [Luteibacter sp. UNCMF331Sha3.1]
MGRLRRGLAAIALALAIVGCSQEAMIEKFTPHPEAEEAKKAIDDWRTGNLTDLRPMLAQDLAAQVTDEQLAAMVAAFPHGAPRSAKVIGATTQFQSDTRRYDITYEYDFDGRWLVASAVILKVGEAARIAGLHGEMRSQSMEQTNAFTLANKGGLHLLMLFLAIAAPVFCVVVCVVCVRTPFRRRKVAWALFTLVGVCTVHFNWTTGQANFSPLSVQLLAASTAAAPFGPWILGVSLPFGAIMFLIRRKALVAAAKAAGSAAA